MQQSTEFRFLLEQLNVQLTNIESDLKAEAKKKKTNEIKAEKCAA